MGRLVVDENYRGKRVGEILINKIKERCVQQSISSLRVRYNIKRKEAHAFYLKLGFSESKDRKCLNRKYKSK
ncbi:MAG: GNAT family N-acetyltransferase [Flavisolibacter sp.]